MYDQPFLNNIKIDGKRSSRVYTSFFELSRIMENTDHLKKSEQELKDIVQLTACRAKKEYNFINNF